MTARPAIMTSSDPFAIDNFPGSISAALKPLKTQQQKTKKK
jgi:hypothetical protein